MLGGAWTMRVARSLETVLMMSLSSTVRLWGQTDIAQNGPTARWKFFCYVALNKMLVQVVAFAESGVWPVNTMSPGVNIGLAWTNLSWFRLYRRWLANKCLPARTRSAWNRSLYVFIVAWMDVSRISLLWYACLCRSMIGPGGCLLSTRLYVVAFLIGASACLNVCQRQDEGLPVSLLFPEIMSWTWYNFIFVIFHFSYYLGAVCLRCQIIYFANRAYHGRELVDKLWSSGTEHVFWYAVCDNPVIEKLVRYARGCFLSIFYPLRQLEIPVHDHQTYFLLNVRGNRLMMFTIANN